ncbi:DNA polymerase III subunit chi [Zophobihabitans entericus]|uniref:DNA polymerase III subunit chi n=1 Tax=Zophobihabitans entericus TaxID=1635327 RepID=A0A6G9ICR8_9GAMM|nr:DNA polymerase III subunit chi [Zophobihabitans entericus]QIQ22028.1 DNA polymerase III subunit chi [Zophobihabitans entericus]
MKKVLFYLFEDAANSNAVSGQLTPEEIYACQKAIEAWKNKVRVLIACQSQTQAEKIDEYLWQLNTEDFVPHNLAGEGPKGGAPVEICWPQKRGSGARQLLINLQDDIPDFAAFFSDVIDFVPSPEQQKNLARERYKSYKNLGFNLKTIPVVKS